MNGQEYVTVKASASNSRMRSSVNSGSATGSTYTVIWEFAGGITGSIAWGTITSAYGDQIRIDCVPNDVEGTNRAIVTAIDASEFKFDFLSLMQRAGCAF